ncbi:MAG: MarR family transcriptional regulator [Gammaproteobacteria bacterium]|nr:MarR family transcriptional regulator [Gammaproteobacteria bacterium]
MNRVKAKGRRDSGTFVALPTVILTSDNYRTLSPVANKLFSCLLSQLTFGEGGAKNNGDLCASFSIANKWGIGSKTTLNKAIKELLERGWIERTRTVVFTTGERNKPNLYAFTYLAIDECGGKCTATRAPSSKWKQWTQN